MRGIKKGDKVIYTDDFGKQHETTATSKPWQLGHGDWVIKLDGIRGGYDLERVQLLEKDDA